MFKDTYKSANERIAISETAKVLAIDKINGGGRRVKYSYLVAIPIAAIVLVTALTLLPRGIFAPLPQAKNADSYSLDSTIEGAVGDAPGVASYVMPTPETAASGDSELQETPEASLNYGLLGEPAYSATDAPASDKGAVAARTSYSEFTDSVQKFSYSSAAKVLAEPSKENQVYSPTSLYMALAMLTSGAGGETRDELLATMSISTPATLDADSDTFFNSLLFEGENGQSRPANSVWFNNTYAIKTPALNNLVESHNASVYAVDFTDAATSQVMSRWVSENTGGKLGGDPKAFEYSADTAMALFNTLYFNEQWQDKFMGESAKADFNLADKATVKVDYMHEKTDANYIETTDAVSYARRFKNGSSMTFILPKDGVSVTDIVSIPASIIAATDPKNRKYATVDFTLPKFNFNTSTDLVKTIKAMGVTAAFDKKAANFDGFTDTPIWVSSVKQDATISIDEKGCEAAAFTNIAIDGASALEKQKLDEVNIHLDRPFAFVINDLSGTPLFIGTVNNPAI